MWINKRVTVGGGFDGTLQSKYRVYLDPVWSVKQMSRLLTLYMRYARRANFSGPRLYRL